MIGQKEKALLAKLMQYGYDRNVIAHIEMNGEPELEGQLEELVRLVIKANWDYFNTSENQYTDRTKQHICMRFCVTSGIGAAWFWCNKREDVLSKGLFECMEKPRTAYEMDEYIEDVTGIWWSSNSQEHYTYHNMFDDCFTFVENNYDLCDKEQELNAGHLLAFYGMFCGYTRIYRESAITPYKGDMPYHWEIWEALYGVDEGERLKEYNDWAKTAVSDGKMGIGDYVIVKDPESEYGKKIEFYRQFTYKENAGIRSIGYMDDKQFNLLTATPIFDTTRNYNLVIDHVYVWESGVEATIEAHFVDDEDCHITFYDTNYLENKDRYYLGFGYTFDLYAIAVNAEIVPEDNRSFTFEGEQAESFREKIGEKQKYDKNGRPESIVFNTENMYSFLQIDDKFPETAEFQAPVLKVYDDVDYLGKRVYEIEIGISYRDFERGDEKHRISVYIAAEKDGKPTRKPVEGEPIRGVLYFQGKMHNMINMRENPSTLLHSFYAADKYGEKTIFTHICNEGEVGQIMTEDEKKAFAKEVFYKHLFKQVKAFKLSTDVSDNPDFKLSRNREIWIKADSTYSAAQDFVSEDKEKYLTRAYKYCRRPVIVYVTLYYTDGKECKWEKGGVYIAKISYGSVLPGQKMPILSHQNHNKLVEYLSESFEQLDTRKLSRYLHKDLDFWSYNLADPIITKDEYLDRTEKVNENIRNGKGARVKTLIDYDEKGEAYIKLQYRNGIEDVAVVETFAGLITAISIKHIKGVIP